MYSCIRNYDWYQFSALCIGGDDSGNYGFAKTIHEFTGDAESRYISSACKMFHVCGQVFGLDMQVWTISSAGKVTDRLPVQLPPPQAITKAAMESGTPSGTSMQTPATGSNPYMDLALGTEWLPGSDTCLVVTMPVAVLVFDLAKSARHPVGAVVIPGTDLIASSAVGTHVVSHAEVCSLMVACCSAAFLAVLSW